MADVEEGGVDVLEGLQVVFGLESFLPFFVFLVFEVLALAFVGAFEALRGWLVV